MLQANKIINSFLEGLTPRQKTVIIRRFGLVNAEPQTLAAIGADFKVTRERIRQIEAVALSSLKDKITSEPACNEIIKKGINYLKTAGGVIKKESLLNNFKNSIEGLNENHLSLVLASSGAFYFYPEDDEFHSFYCLDKKNSGLAKNFINKWTGFLANKKDEIFGGKASKKKYEEEFKSFIKRSNVSAVFANNYIGVSKRIHANSFGDVGLREWSEIRPRTVRDKIYLVLKKDGKPLHFETIAESINKAGLDDKKALIATVHNELIKDNRFVLVGRGIYALSEYGYKAGNAKDVIQRIIKENKNSLSAQEVVLAVQKERFLKPNTILINLRNKQFFERLPDGNYRTREA